MHGGGIGERDAPSDERRTVVVNVSDVGVDTRGIAKSGAQVARTAGRNSGTMKNVAGSIEFLAWATSQSPRTGNPTWDDLWADGIEKVLREQCPNGVVTGIQTTRESASYPYVSGEIIRVRAECETK